MNWLTSLFRPTRPPAKLWAGKVYSAQEWATILGATESPVDESYAEVNLDALPEYYSWFVGALGKLGVVKSWASDLDCDNRSWLYCDLAPVYWYLQGWTAGRPDAQSPAFASYLYWLDWSQPGHVIAAVGTQRGLVFIEPQTGLIVPQPTAQRRRTIT